MMKKVLLITDNEELLRRFRELVSQKDLENQSGYKFQYAFSQNNLAFLEKYGGNNWINPVNVKGNVEELIEQYDLIISLHCKQIFPAKLVNNIRCINIHPGLNPYNRGWYPQVFSIINGLPCGATIHEIDEKLDHGPVICQKEVDIKLWDTSLTAYNKILDAEMELLEAHFESILQGNYTTEVKTKGNVNLQNDFKSLCLIELENIDSFQNHINKLRALTHGNYSNAYLIDEKGKKIYLKLELIPEE